MAEIDLERLSDAYRLRPMSEYAAKRAALSSEQCRGWLVDIGGGTGEHAATWVGPGRHPIVVDPSESMVQQADRRPGVFAVRGRAQELPIRPDTADLAYFHLSIHYGDWRHSIDEAFRITRGGGRIEIWTMGHDAIARSSLSRWFPKVTTIDMQRFPDPSEVAGRCSKLGGHVEVSEMREPIHRTAGEWMAAVEGRFVSTLQLLSDDDIAEGLTRFADNYPDRNEPYRYEMTLTRISTTVRPLL